MSDFPIAIYEVLKLEEIKGRCSEMAYHLTAPLKN